MEEASRNPMRRKKPVIPVLLGVICYTSQVRSQPFIPDTTPRCSISITRGAQKALDAYLQDIETKQQSEKNDMYMQYLEIRGRGENTAGIEASMRIKEISNRYYLKTKSIEKIEEMQKYAAKKYKCLVEVMSIIP